MNHHSSPSSRLRLQTTGLRLRLGRPLPTCRDWRGIGRRVAARWRGPWSGFVGLERIWRRTGLVRAGDGQGAPATTILGPTTIQHLHLAPRLLIHLQTQRSLIRAAATTQRHHHLRQTLRTVVQRAGPERRSERTPGFGISHPVRHRAAPDAAPATWPHLRTVLSAAPDHSDPDPEALVHRNAESATTTSLVARLVQRQHRHEHRHHDHHLGWRVLQRTARIEDPAWRRVERRHRREASSASATATSSAPAAAPSRSIAIPPATPPAAPVDIPAITRQVMSAIDRRLHSWRERTGRI